MQQDNQCCIILAAGEGKRMHAAGSKVLCEVAYKPLLSWVIDAVRGANIKDVCVVASSDDVKQAARGCDIYEQKERLGTGHAVMCAKGFLQNRGGHTLVLNGDAPFIDAQTITDAFALHCAQDCDVTVVSAVVEDATGYGRIVRDADTTFRAIVEHADCTPEMRAITEINSGAFWFKTQSLLDALSDIKPDNAQGEYYLTDAVAILLHMGRKAACYTAASADIVLGANSPADLLALNEIAIARIFDRHLQNGVSFIQRDGVIIGPDVRLAPGAQILPGSILSGNTTVGQGSVIGPHSVLHNTTVGCYTTFNASRATDSTVGDHVTIGPYSQLRPHSAIADRVKIGDFVEIKNAAIGEGTSVAHLTYIGDADVGKYCNFGCGVVFVNYDGESKNRIQVKDYAFIGCNTNLIAPVEIGRSAYTAAGVTVTHNVPDGALAMGRVKQENKAGWALRKLKKYVEKKSK